MNRVISFAGTACALLAALLLSSAPAPAQKFKDAIQRSEDAGRIITLLAVLPDAELPKEVMDKAQAVGVFPKVRKETALFSSTTIGFGVISARGDGGWTMPAYYAFGGGGFGNPFARNETYGVILLFMTKDAVDAFEKGGVQLKNERRAVEGPIGKVTDEQRKELEGAKVVAYSYFNGRLQGTAFGKSFWKSFSLNPDNNINKPLYGMKGREVLAGKAVDASTLPTGVPAFRDALVKYY